MLKFAHNTYGILSRSRLTCIILLTDQDQTQSFSVTVLLCLQRWLKSPVFVLGEFCLVIWSLRWGRWRCCFSFLLFVACVVLTVVVSLLFLLVPLVDYFCDCVALSVHPLYWYCYASRKLAYIILNPLNPTFI